MGILCACCWLYSGIAIGIILKLQNKMKKPSKADKNQGMDSVSQMFTVKLDALPKTVDERFNAKAIKELFHEKYGEIIAVHIVPKMDELSNLYSNMDQVEDMLQYLKN